MFFKRTLLLLTAASLAGCGTVNTVFRDDAVTSSKLARWGSHCDGVSRIYSGTLLDFCSLNAEPRRNTGIEGQPGVSLVLLDMGLSAVADTLLLPYTVYLHNEHGDIPKSRIE